MKSLLAALALVATPASAHCYREWHYNFPQNCSIRTRAAAYHPVDRRWSVEITAMPPVRDIPLPSLEWVPVADPDDATLARLRLRGMLSQ